MISNTSSLKSLLIESHPSKKKSHVILNDVIDQYADMTASMFD